MKARTGNTCRPSVKTKQRRQHKKRKDDDITKVKQETKQLMANNTWQITQDEKRQDNTTLCKGKSKTRQRRTQGKKTI
jgi:hypothetical protein